jgi:hypothetical protein
MKLRIALWAAAGLAVASAWAVYFYSVSRVHPIGPSLPILARLTWPVVNIGLHYPVSINAALAANVVTYALLGLLVESLRRQSKHSN